MLRTGVFDLVTERAAAIALIGSLLALWGAASGIGALMKGLDRAYGVTRPALSWRREVRRLVATIVVPPLGLALLIVSALAHALTTGLGALMGVSEQVAALVAALQLPLTFAVVFAAMTIVYWKLPTPRQRYRDVLPGSLVAAVGWSLITQAFGLYIADADAYGAAYGVFGAAIAFLLWLYLVSLVTLIGAEVNALVAGSRQSVA
jgi:membrane protein